MLLRIATWRPPLDLSDPLYYTGRTRTDGVGVAELELEAKRVTFVDGILVENLDVKKPLLQTVGRDQFYAGWQACRLYLEMAGT